MAPGQVTGQAGQAADIFAWAVTLTYAASGQMPFGTGSVDAVLYRVLHIEPDTSAVPDLLRPMVDAALAKDPHRRPRADGLLTRLTSRTPADRDKEFSTQAVLARTWQATEATPVAPPTSGSLLLEPAPPGTGRPRRGTLGRRTAAVGGPVIAVLAAVVVLALLTGHFPGFGHLAANEQNMMGGGRTSGHLDQPGRADLDPGGHPRHHPARRPAPGAAAHGADTVISGGVPSGGTSVTADWLSTDGGSTWTAVTIPADHGAGGSLSGLGSDGSGLIAVRVGQAATDGPDGVAYFSPNGQDWQYAGTIDAAGGWQPNVVKGGPGGFVVTGQTSAGQIVAYTSNGTGGIGTWQPTGWLGQASTESVASATVATGGTVIAVSTSSGARSVSSRCS
jgi:hypothetical protein